MIKIPNKQNDGQSFNKKYLRTIQLYRRQNVFLPEMFKLKIEINLRGYFTLIEI